MHTSLTSYLTLWQGLFYLFIGSKSYLSWVHSLLVKLFPMYVCSSLSHKPLAVVSMLTSGIISSERQVLIVLKAICSNSSQSSAPSGLSLYCFIELLSWHSCSPGYMIGHRMVGGIRVYYSTLSNLKQKHRSTWRIVSSMAKGIVTFVFQFDF